MYNFTHLKSKVLKRNLRLRAEVLFRIREYFYKNSFIEISTPVLSFPTKEYGDGEFIAISKLHPGKYYSLPHSPQLYKQYLIAGLGEEGVKYFQLASNFRPEMGDATHAQEFQQLDFEIANADVFLIKQVISDVVKLAFSIVGIKVKYIELTYEYCVSHFGSDSPDLRYSNEIEEDPKGRLTIVFKRKDIIKRKLFKELVSLYDGLELCERKNVFIVHGGRDKIFLLGELRNKLIHSGALKLYRDWSFVWIKDLPLFVTRECGGLRTFHHPQMAPLDDNLKKLDLRSLLKIKSAGCELIVNGIEVAGGNVRNHRYGIQRQILCIVGSTIKELATTYKPLLTLLKHFPNYRSGGAAIGFDRLMMLLTDSKDIRNVQPFPMSLDGLDFMGGPWPLSEDETARSLIS